MMKIILQEDVPHLGVVGDLVSVKDGYARNFLIPQGKAVFASVRSIKELDHQQRLAEHQRAIKTEEATKARSQIEGLSITMEAKVAPPQIGEDGEPIVEARPKLFGSITNRDLAKALAQADVKVDHRRVTLSAPVRAVGSYQAKVRLDGGIEAQLPFWVLPEGTADVEAEKKRIEEAVAEAEAAAAAAAEAEAAKAAEAEKAAEVVEAAKDTGDTAGDESTAEA
ncbi:MAG: 50S ribosomal protein L9 [Myxococcota bacterium]